MSNIKNTLKFKWNGNVDLFDKTTYGPSEVVFLLWLTLAFIWFFYILFCPSSDIGGIARVDKIGLGESDGQRDSMLRLKQEEDKALQLEVFRLHQKKEERARLDKIVVEDSSREIDMDLVIIPAGKFVMGSLGKGHEVKITKSFYMGKYEVTQEQWITVMKNNPSTKSKSASLPVTDVSWTDCQEFIYKLNDKTKGGYRLPTEAEWEYACRAGTTTAYSFGNEITPQDANYGDVAVGRIKAVGSYKPNAFGLYDMHGNVWEWCQDWFGAGYYANSPLEDPQGPATGEGRVFRGGSIGDSASFAFSSNRNYNPPNIQRSYLLGFRLARTK
jgi:formylglycine-generating enzyme required for sulfatase activity